MRVEKLNESSLLFIKTKKGQVSTPKVSGLNSFSMGRWCPRKANAFYVFLHSGQFTSGAMTLNVVHHFHGLERIKRLATAYLRTQIALVLIERCAM
jgi:hypothetical protein